MAVVGGAIIGLAWPGTELETSSGLFEDPELKDTGSAAGVWFGGVVAWVGNVLLFVGLIGWGVKLGRDASPQAAS